MIFQTVANKSDFTPLYIKLNNTLEFFSLVFHILILFCSLAFQVVSTGTNLTLKMYKPWVQKTTRNEQILPSPTIIWILYWSWTLINMQADEGLINRADINKVPVSIAKKRVVKNSKDQTFEDTFDKIKEMLLIGDLQGSQIQNSYENPKKAALFPKVSEISMYLETIKDVHQDWIYCFVKWIASMQVSFY